MMDISEPNTPLIYLDNAATTYPKPDIVWRTMDEFARSGGANANRGQNPAARRAARLVEETRFKVGQWLGLNDPNQVTFAPSATVALNQVILGTTLTVGAGVYVSPFEHNSTLRPLAHLSQTTGINLKEIPFHPTRLEVEWEKLEVLWRQLPPAMLVISQASNVCGLLLPVEEIAKQARKANPSVIIIMDGAQAAGLYPLNLQSGLVDYLIWSGHKSFYGPFGVAGIAFCTDKRPEPMLFGGTGTFSESLEMPTQLPSAYEPGSLNSPAIAGLNAALDWLKETEREAITQHATQLMQQLETRLKNVSGVKLVGVTSNQRAPVLSFSVSGVSPQALEEFLGSKGIAVRAGLHCAPWAHRFLDTQKRGGTVRVSFSYFNQSKQIDCLITALETLSN